MPLFNKRIIQQHLILQEIPSEHLTVLQDWQTMIDSRNLAKHPETAVESSFINKLLETVLGYQTIGHGDNYTLAQEYPIGRGKVDVALGRFSNDKQTEQIQAVFEFKGAKTRNLDAIMSGRIKSPVQQAWDYARDAKGCQWILVSNYLEIRLYAFGETSLVYEHFDLAKLTEPQEYARFILCLHARNLLSGNTKELLKQSQQAEKEITNKLYGDYKDLREQLLTRLIADNPEIAPVDLIAPAQKLLDRVLFVAFAEDKGLIPAKSIEKAYKFINPYEDPKPKYETFKGLFNAVNKGRDALKIFGYNGGLFAADKMLDRLNVADELCAGFLKIAEYDFDSEISVTVLGHIFEQSISDLEEISQNLRTGSPSRTASPGKRKQHGIVYTPDHITAFIVEHTLGDYLRQRFSQVLSEFGEIKEDGSLHWKKGKQTELKFWYEWQKTLKATKVVDPACGSGAFLVAAFDVLYVEYQRTNEKIDEITEKPNIGLLDLNKDILNFNLSGVDINLESIEITKLSLWLKTAERGKKLATIEQHLQVGNSLGIHAPVTLNLTGLKDLSGLETAFCWQQNFSKIIANGGFDVVLGNPPYVRQELLSDLKAYLQAHYAVYHGVADLYAYFFELGLKILKPHGMLGFISSSTFFKTGSGEPLRKFLLENATLKKVVDFGDLQVFEGVTTYPAILIFQKAKATETCEIRMLALKNTDAEFMTGSPSRTASHAQRLSDLFAARHAVMPHSQLRADSWQLEDARLNQLREKLTLRFPTLKEVYGSPLYGIKTGLNEAFVIDGATKDKLIAQDPKSAELLKPFLEGKDLKKWHSQPRDLWLILIPKGWTQKQIGELQEESKSWEWLNTHYPSIAQWFAPFADKGRKRSDKGDFWWELRACAYYDLFEKPQIVYPVISQGAKFSIENTVAYSNDKTFMLMSADYFGLGLLNSKAMWFIVSGSFASLRGGEWRFELRGQDMEKLPIPPASTEQKQHISQLAQQCQTLAEQRYALENKTRRRFADLGVKKCNQKLEHWWQLDFQSFQTELKKFYKIEIKLKDRDDWQDLLEEATKQHQAFNLQINTLEQQLNQAVYQLFDLTEEEIKLIENN